MRAPGSFTKGDATPNKLATERLPRLTPPSRSRVSTQQGPRGLARPGRLRSGRAHAEVRRMLALAAALSLALAAPAAAPPARADVLPFRASELTLANGLRVIVVPT